MELDGLRIYGRLSEVQYDLYNQKKTKQIHAKEALYRIILSYCSVYGMGGQ